MTVRISMAAWRQHTSRWRLGRLGWTGLGLLLLAVATDMLLVQPRLAQREALEARLATASRAPRGLDALVADADARLADFQQALPRTASVPQWLGRIRAAAQANGLALRSGDYKLERNADAPYLRYRISLPLSGSYGQIRGFIGAVLAEVPAAAVDDVQLKRDVASGRQLDGRVRLSLFIAAD